MASPIDSKLIQIPNAEVRIIDIRGSTLVSNTSQDIMNAITTGLSTHSVPFTDPRLVRKGEQPSTKLLRSLPTMLLYDDKGLDIFDQITYDKDYYLTKAEIDILIKYSRDMVRDYVKDGSVLIELGAG